MSCDVGEATERLENELCSLSGACDVAEAKEGMENEL